MARGLAAIAITDHDVLTGLVEARAAAGELGVELIDGIELTADWDGRVCHILGYGIDPANPVLNAALAAGEARMADHVDEMLAAIRASGHELSIDDLARYNTRYATGTSVVLGMIEKGILRGAANARQLLARATREPRAYTAAEAIGLIHDAGGVAALAHPVRLRRGEPLLGADTLAPLVAQGLDGLEVWHVLQRSGPPSITSVWPKRWDCWRWEGPTVMDREVAGFGLVVRMCPRRCSQCCKRGLIVGSRLRLLRRSGGPLTRFPLLHFATYVPHADSGMPGRLRCASGYGDLDGRPHGRKPTGCSGGHREASRAWRGPLGDLDPPA